MTQLCRIALCLPKFYRPWSPRGGFSQQSSSPRSRGRGGLISPRLTSGGGLVQRRTSASGSPHLSSPSSSYTTVGKGLPPPIKNVEQMSSDSSSSSSSDDGSPS